MDEMDTGFSYDMGELQEEIKQEPFLGIIHFEEEEDALFEEKDKFENAASIKNPNMNDDRRLFQVYRPDFF